MTFFHVFPPLSPSKAVRHGGEYADSHDPDVIAAREEVFYENREGRREEDDGLLGFFSNWVY